MDLVHASAAGLAAAIRERRISAVELLRAHLAQIEQENPRLNAVVTLNAEGALQQARAADAALARGEVRGPLHGVPFTLKDAFATAGMRTTVGFEPLADYIPPEDSTVAARLKAAGAILMGKTNVPAMLADYQTDNRLFGRTNHPRNPGRTPGGSSGGAAAAVAAGMSPFEIGTDLSGSIRIPAAFCGLFGLKPTENRVPLTGVVPDPGAAPRSVRIMSCVGPLARTAGDLALLFRLIAGPDGRDTEVQPVPVAPAPEVALHSVRVAVAPTFPGFPVATEIRTAVASLASELRPFCAAVEAAELPPLDYYQELRSAGELIGMITGGGGTTFAEYMTALHRRDQSIWAWEQFFGEWDVLLCPACMVTAFPHCEPGTPILVAGREENYYMVSAHTTLFNYTGHPAVVVPCGLDSAGLPIGVQLVTRRWDEARLLAIAEAISSTWSTSESS